MTATDSRSAIVEPTPMANASAGPDSLGGQVCHDTHNALAAEDQISPQANPAPAPIDETPAGSNASHGHATGGTHSPPAVAVDIPGGQQVNATHYGSAAGDQTPPAAKQAAQPSAEAPLADPLLALAADVLDDLEKVRIANENRLRQLTRSEEDSDGETRGFGLDESHPDVARLAALVGLLSEAEHKAELNIGRLMRNNPLGPWVKQTNGIGTKQGARLLAAISDPYIRPEITREDGTVEASRPRTVSELWAYAGYHVIQAPVSGQGVLDTQRNHATDGSSFPADHDSCRTHAFSVGGEQAGHPGHNRNDDHRLLAGVAPKRARGQQANWSATAKMRAHLVAVSCMKHLDSPYRKVYDDAREKYAEAVHQVPCIRCGPKGKPAPPGSPLSDGHKHARALRAIAKEVLKDLWREAKRIHEGDAG